MTVSLAPPGRRLFTEFFSDVPLVFDAVHHLPVFPTTLGSKDRKVTPQDLGHMGIEARLVICPHGFNKCAQKSEIPSTVASALVLRVVRSLAASAKIGDSEGRHVPNYFSMSKMKPRLAITYQGGVGDHREGSSCSRGEFNINHLGKS